MMELLFDWKFYAAVAFAWTLGAGTGWTYRALHSVSNSTHDKTVTALATATGTIKTMQEAGKQQEADDERKAQLLRSQAAGAAVRANAAEVQRDYAQQEVSRLQAQNGVLFRAVQLSAEQSGGVRDEYNAGRDKEAGPAADPSGARSSGGQITPAPLTLDVYVEVCSRNRVAQDAQAKEYDELLGLAKGYRNQCGATQ